VKAARRVTEAEQQEVELVEESLEVSG